MSEPVQPQAGGSTAAPLLEMIRGWAELSDREPPEAGEMLRQLLAAAAPDAGPAVAGGEPSQKPTPIFRDAGGDGATLMLNGVQTSLVELLQSHF